MADHNPTLHSISTPPPTFIVGCDGDNLALVLAPGNNPDRGIAIALTPAGEFSGVRFPNTKQLYRAAIPGVYWQDSSHHVPVTFQLTAMLNHDGSFSVTLATGRVDPAMQAKTA